MVEPAAAATDGLGQDPGDSVARLSGSYHWAGANLGSPSAASAPRCPVRVVPTDDVAVLLSAPRQAGRLTRDQPRLFSSAPAK
jgi:hypothetical protein